MSEANVPRVSVCIPVFNAAPYLRQAVLSALGQNYRDFEIVIVDNGSTDGSDGLAEDLQKENKNRIRFYKNDSNIGLVGNLNRCLTHAKGAYIKFLCADDLLLPGCLEEMAAGLDAQESVKLVAGGRSIIDQRGHKLTIRRYTAANVVVPGKQAISECLFGSHYIGEPTAVMFRRRDPEGGFREDMPQVSDIDLWFRLLEDGDLFYIGAPLCAIRQHADQMTNANIRSGALIDDNMKLFEAYAHKAYIRPTWRQVVQHRLYMTYRVWMSRPYLSTEKRAMVLNRYGSTWAYWLMPAARSALRVKERVWG